MKKSFLFVSVVAAMLFVGCTGDKKSKPEAVNSKDSCVVMEGVASDKASLVTYTLPSVANTSRCKDYNLTSYIHIGTPIAGSQAKLKDSKQICEHIVNERNDLSECHRAQVITCLKADAKTRMYDIEVIKRELRRIEALKLCYATSGDAESGIMRVLYPLEEPGPGVRLVNIKVKERNLLKVTLDNENQIFVGVGNQEQNIVALKDLKEIAKAFIFNATNDKNLPEKRQTDIYLPDGSTWNYPVSRGIVVLQFNENTSYECYLQVQNELGLAFDDIRNTVARNKFGKGLDQLTDCEEESLIKAVPMVIQEANPLFVVADSVKIRNLEYTSTFSALKPSKCNEPARYEEEFDIVRLEDRPIGPSRRREIDVYSGIIEIVPNDEKIDTTIDFYEFTEDEFAPVEIFEELIVEEQILVSAEVMPSFQGGDLRTFHAWVQKNVKYPEIAQENGIQGRVLLQFVIEKDGTLGQVKVLQTPDLSLTDEAIRVVTSAPKWSPAMNKNKPVRINFTMPIEFRLPN